MFWGLCLSETQQLAFVHDDLPKLLVYNKLSELWRLYVPKGSLITSSRSTSTNAQDINFRTIAVGASMHVQSGTRRCKAMSPSSRRWGGRCKNPPEVGFGVVLIKVS